MINKGIRRGLILALIAGCVGCAMRSGGTLEQRVEDYWTAVVDKRWDDAYDYMSPGYRSALSPEEFAARQRGRTVQWTRAGLDDAPDCSEEQTCSVRIRVHYQVQRGLPGLQGPIEMDRVVRQNWLRSGNAWYFVPDDL